MNNFLRCSIVNTGPCENWRPYPIRFIWHMGRFRLVSSRRLRRSELRTDPIYQASRRGSSQFLKKVRFPASRPPARRFVRFPGGWTPRLPSRKTSACNAVKTDLFGIGRPHGRQYQYSISKQGSAIRESPSWAAASRRMNCNERHGGTRDVCFRVAPPLFRICSQPRKPPLQHP
jgi:hypothetical protein